MQIHHIDSDNKNNTKANLAVLCGNCHSDAHAKKALSQNLTPARVTHARDEWETKLDNFRANIATESFQRRSADSITQIGISWGYINHARVSQLLNETVLQQLRDTLLQNAVARGIVDEFGFIIGLERSFDAYSYVSNTLYDQLPHGDDHVLHNLYSAFVDLISIQLRPIHLSEECWSKKFFHTLVKPGAYVFVQKSWDFKKKEDKQSRTAQIRARTRKKSNILVEFEMNTKDMFGTTSITVSFTGTGAASAFLLVKDIQTEGNIFKIICSPIAVGTGSWPMTIDSAVDA